VSSGIGQASKAIRELRESAASGGRWYVFDGSIYTVMVNTSKEAEPDFTAYEVVFETSDERFASFSVDISRYEGITPGSSSPSFGWVGWLNGDVVLAWQWPEGESQGIARWDGRSPMPEDEDADDYERARELGYARLAAAIICHMWEVEDRALLYLPERQSDAGAG
jgi:hypothetical protein